MTTFIKKALGLLVFVFRSNGLYTFLGQIKWKDFHNYN